MKLSEILIHRRGMKELNATDVAAMANIPRRTYWRYEHGQSIPSDRLLTILNVLGGKLTGEFVFFKDGDVETKIKIN